MQKEDLSLNGHIEQGGLGRHETFTPRYGWLKKGYEAAVQDEKFYKAPDAIERLGVGKNMVSSIRFWCQAFKIIETNNNGCVSTTELGRKLLDDKGWDPFLEDVASLWLLHWHLFVPRLEAVSWSLAFNKCNLWSFDIKQLSKVVFNATQKYPRFEAISENTFERDASCIIRMYSEEPLEKETEINCPFTQLGLIRKAGEKNSVCFDTTEKRNLPDLILIAACFSYLTAYVPKSQRTISLSRLTYDFNSPGVVFKLSESVVGSYLDKASKKIKGVSLLDNGGNIQLYFEEDPQDLYWNALEKYYTELQK